VQQASAEIVVRAMKEVNRKRHQVF